MAKRQYPTGISNQIMNQIAEDRTMMVQAEASLYPLETLEIGEPIEQFLDQLSCHAVSVTKGNMSSLIEGEAQKVFPALCEAFERVASASPVVLLVKISNACPSLRRSGRRQTPGKSSRA